MQKVKAISLILIGVLVTILVGYLLEPRVELDNEVIKVPLSDTQTLIGYRNNAGGATTGFSYYFYVKSNESEKLPSAFLITDTPDVTFQIKEQGVFSLHVDGKVYQFTNNVWVNEQGKLIPIAFEFTAKNRLVSSLKCNDQR
ncbi:hypothetical protein [Vibrio cholerae]|uniref:hypothetical protein n=1 Tax=Vibrio cholerae TaxID=666 RepID=UPI00301ABEBD|nr:hypothetical protein [Vibrio cholerae]